MSAERIRHVGLRDGDRPFARDAFGRAMFPAAARAAAMRSMRRWVMVAGVLLVAALAAAL